MLLKRSTSALIKKEEKEIYLGAAAKQRSRFPSALQPAKTKEAGGGMHTYL